MGKHAVLFGGGLDSSAVLSRLVTKQKDGEDIQSLDDILLIHVDYGQKAVVSERTAALRQIEYYGLTTELVTLKMDMSYSGAAIMPNTDLGTGEAKNNVLELRNPTLMLLSASYLASVYPGVQHYLYVGLHREPKGSPFKDAIHYLYVDKVNALINTLLGNGSSVLVRAPYKNGSRQSLFHKLLNAQGMDFIRNYVHTCYEQVPCGKCTHCIKLEEMIKSVGEETC